MIFANNPMCPDDDEDNDWCPPCPGESLGSVFLIGLVGAAAAALGTWIVETIRSKVSSEDEDGDGA